MTTMIEFTDQDTQASSLKPGDLVVVHAEVLQVLPAVGVHVRISGRNGHTETWLLPASVAGRIAFDVPEEPGDLTYLVGEFEGRPTAFLRNDRLAPTDDGRRYPLRWCFNGEWIGWQQACEYGAAQAAALKSSRAARKDPYVTHTEAGWVVAIDEVDADGDLIKTTCWTGVGDSWSTWVRAKRFHRPEDAAAEYARVLGLPAPRIPE